MKQSASTRFGLFRISIQLMNFLVLITLMPLVHSFTPPQIIYGGWTPILPGHPFFFGTARKKHYENSHESPYIQSSPHYLQHLQPPGPHSDLDHGGHYPPHGGHPSAGDVGYQHHSQQYRDHPQEPQGHPNDHKHSKDIFSYYPPQSSYDGASKPQNLNYKPVYIEVPRKPMDLYENPHQFVPYILPSIKSLLTKGFKTNDGDQERTYLKIAPFGKVDPSSIHPVGHINLDVNLEKIRYLHGDSVRDGPLSNHLRSHDSPRFPPLAHVESDLFVNNKQLHKEEPHKVHESVNVFKGARYPTHHPNVPSSNLNGNEYSSLNSGQKQYLVYQQPKSSNTSPHYTKAGGYQQQSYISNHPLVSHAQSYPTTIEVYPDSKFASSHRDPSTESAVTKELYSTSGVSKGLSNPVKIVRSKKYPQTIYEIGEPKLYITPGRYQYDPYEALKNSYMPQVLNHYVYKNKKIGKRYRKPRILTDIHETPTIVDREVAIVHVPAKPSYVSHGTTYPDQIEAHSNPQSTQIVGEHKRSRDLRHHPNLDFVINEPHATHDGSQDIAVEGLTLKESDAIFVGTRGLDANEVQKVTETTEELDDQPPSKDAEGTRQFFHAYYASSNHVPPKGYTKMSLDEFKTLFQNAEIQHIPRQQADELRLNRDYEKRND